MHGPVDKEGFLRLLQPVTAALQGLDVAAPDVARLVEQRLPVRGAALAALKQAAFAAVDSEWLLPKSNAGIRFGRLTKDLSGFSVDAVLMDRPGPEHRHPNGEFDLCWARAGAPKFDGKPEGWVVYGKGSVHVPTVTGGEMLILYFLPGGAIEFSKA